MCRPPSEYEITDDYVKIKICDRWGNPKAEAFVSLDKLDLVKEHRWCVCNGYAMTKINGEYIYLHNLIGNGEVVDHKNRNRLDCRNDNLRPCNKLNNNRNLSMKKNNTSGITGVSWSKNMNKWESSITVNYKKINLGYYEDINMAKQARLDAEKYYFGDYAPSNN